VGAGWYAVALLTAPLVFTAVTLALSYRFARSPGWLCPVNEALQPSHVDIRTTPVQTSGAECRYQFRL
jgi:hypothetical protein